MKKNIICLLVALTAMLVTSCATVYPAGSLFVDVKLPVATGNYSECTKTGRATCKSFLGLITTGDASIQAACKNAGITQISYIDWETKNVLGLIGEYTIVVHGN